MSAGDHVPEAAPGALASEELSERLPYFSTSEVAVHNLATDCWVSFFGFVYDLTSLLAQHKGQLAEPIVAHAGTDISDWFDAKTREPKRWVEPNTGIEMPYTPHGRYVHIPPPLPSANLSTRLEVPWWRDTQYRVGRLSQRKRVIRIVNTLTGKTDSIEVCSEETLGDILSRYLKYNRHARSYTWKRLGRPLNMDKTLDENGIPDETEELDSDYVPAITLHFRDDLTEA